MPDHQRRPSRFPPPFARAWGDDRYGLWAEFFVSAGEARVVQRLRWVEPGTFLMGSPWGEAKRHADEGPQHSVTLSRGYWLADTACTLGLWQAVMGENPNGFERHAELPVWNMSWNDVQWFLQKLQVLLRGCEVSLPTEAEWEYACRAGTDTPFSFGETVTTEQVNYHAYYPYLSGKRGEYRGHMMPVKSLAANEWGLYQMHGNIYEWCLDGLRQYGSEPMVDPVGPMGGGQRVFRGGSWNDGAFLARSAFRLQVAPTLRGHDLGFRLCLRSIEPGQSSSLRGARAQL